MASLRVAGGSETIASDKQPDGSMVQQMGTMVWEPTKKEWLRVSGNLKDGEPAVETVPVMPLLINQAGTVDRQRNNQHSLSGLALASRTATASSSLITNYNWTKLHIHLHVAKAGGSGKSLTVSVFDGSANGAESVVARFPIVEAGHNFQLAPGLAELPSTELHNSENVLTANAALPGQFVIQVIPSDATPWEYEVTYDLLV
jgi:hypothetical protein